MEEKLAQRPCNLLKVVLFGPESTGKTTLAKKLAAHYKTEWVPEFMRTYLQKKWDEEKKVCEIDDILPIGIGQMQLENKLSKMANKVLFCDTNILQTKIYSEAYYNNQCPNLLTKFALKNTYDFYFLTYIDIPWEADDLRDKPNEREAMFFRFKTALNELNKPYLILKGSMEERFETATLKIDELIKQKEIGI